MRAGQWLTSQPERRPHAKKGEKSHTKLANTWETVLGTIHTAVAEGEDGGTYRQISTKKNILGMKLNFYCHPDLPIGGWDSTMGQKPKKVDAKYFKKLKRNPKDRLTRQKSDRGRGGL